MKSEKKSLILIFTLLFALSASLIYMMIKHDIQEQEIKKLKMSQNEQTIDTNNWPKVEIQTRQ